MAKIQIKLSKFFRKEEWKIIFQKYLNGQILDFLNKNLFQQSICVPYYSTGAKDTDKNKFKKRKDQR